MHKRETKGGEQKRSCVVRTNRSDAQGPDVDSRIVLLFQYELRRHPVRCHTKHAEGQYNKQLYFCLQ
jgi:hypothetical protein